MTGEIRIQLIKPYQLKTAGEILCVNQGIADSLIARGVAVMAAVKKTAETKIFAAKPHQKKTSGEGEDDGSKDSPGQEKK
jgi:hypothetical protein